MSFSIQVYSNHLTPFQAFTPTVNLKAFDNLKKLQSLNIPGEFLEYDQTDNKVFAKNWTSVLTYTNNEFQIRPMRYGIVPSDAKDFKINNTQTVNINSLSSPSLERSLENFRAIIAVKSYFVMEMKDNKFQINEYKSENGHSFLIPVIYDNWFSEDKSIIIQSFTIITNKLENGLECPLELDMNSAREWLKSSDKLAQLQVVKLVVSDS